MPSGSRRTSFPPTSPTSGGCGRRCFRSDDAPGHHGGRDPWPAIHHPRHYRGRHPDGARHRCPDHHPRGRRPVGDVEAARPDERSWAPRRRHDLRPLQHHRRRGVQADRRHRRHDVDLAGTRDADGTWTAARAPYARGECAPIHLDRRGDDRPRRHVRGNAGAARGHAAHGSHEGARGEAHGRAAAAVEPRRARIRDDPRRARLRARSQDRQPDARARRRTSSSSIPMR